MSTVYVAMINDRHTDPAGYVFSTPEKAIDFARGYAQNVVHDGCEIEEDPIEGWLYHATYCIEGDSVWVLERVIDEPLAGGEET